MMNKIILGSIMILVFLSFFAHGLNFEDKNGFDSACKTIADRTPIEDNFKFIEKEKKLCSPILPYIIIGVGLG